MLMWPLDRPEMKVLIDSLTQAGHEICYWIGEGEGARHAPKETIFHDHYEAWAARPAPAFANVSIEPSSAQYIASLYDTESLIMTMMNKRYDASPVDERKHIYYTMLAYWTHVFDTVKPACVIFDDVPHSIYSNVMYDIARKRNIPTLCFEEVGMIKRILCHRDFWNGIEELRTALQVAQKNGVTLDDLHPEVRDYFIAQKGVARNVTLWYMAEQRNIAVGIGLWVHRLRIARAYPLKALPRALGLLVRYFQANLRTEYTRVQRAVDWDRPFIYFPLNFQPERTTSPQGGIFTDQILAVETIAAALPDGWEVYVKEHPAQWWARTKTRYSSARYRGYYERIAQIPHVRLVPIDTSTFTLTEHAQVTATVSGSAGWEALIRGKKCLVFGIPWYRDCPGALPVRSTEDCKKALVDVRKDPLVKDADIIAFLKAIQEVGVRAHNGAASKVLWPDVSGEENMQVIAETICRELSHK